MTQIMTLLLIVLLTVPAYGTDGARLLEEIDRNLNPDSFEMYRKIINIEPDGRKKEYTFFSVKKGIDKVAGLFLGPASEKGRSTLRLGETCGSTFPVSANRSGSRASSRSSGECSTMPTS